MLIFQGVYICGGCIQIEIGWMGQRKVIRPLVVAGGRSDQHVHLERGFCSNIILKGASKHGNTDTQPFFILIYPP